jgi:hypothetical protein
MSLVTQQSSFENNVLMRWMKPEPYKFIGFGDIREPKPYTLKWLLAASMAPHHVNSKGLVTSVAPNHLKSSGT